MPAVLRITRPKWGVKPFAEGRNYSEMNFRDTSFQFRRGMVYFFEMPEGVVRNQSNIRQYVSGRFGGANWSDTMYRAVATGVPLLAAYGDRYHAEFLGVGSTFDWSRALDRWVRLMAIPKSSGMTFEVGDFVVAKNLAFKIMKIDGVNLFGNTLDMGRAKYVREEVFTTDEVTGKLEGAPEVAALEVKAA